MAINVKPIPRKVQVPTTKKPAVQIPAQSSASNYSAADGFARARAINEKRQRDFEARKFRPIEFNAKVGEGGINGVTVILTDNTRAPNLPYFHYCHRWGFEQGNPQTEVCIQDDPEGCPLCRKLNRKGSYEMVLTCIDTRPFTYKAGPNMGKTVQRSTKPYVVKTSMIPQFERLYRAHKTFRGMVLKVFRDNQKSPSSGSSVEFVRMLSEAELGKYGDLAKPLDYKKAYPRMDAATMARTYEADTGEGGTLGSADFASGAKNDALPF